MHHQSTFSAKIEQLDAMLSWVRKQLDLAQWDAKEGQKIELALEEVLVNVIHYAYTDQIGDIELYCDSEPRQYITFTIIDRGIPFDPLSEAPAVDINQSLDEREIGGLGIFFLRQLMDEVYYERKDMCNVLTIKNRVQ